jgi:chorismate-pyruvate lyase
MRWSGHPGGSERWCSCHRAATRQGAMTVLEFDVKKVEVKMLLEKFSKDADDEENYEEFLEISNSNIRSFHYVQQQRNVVM